MDTDDHNRRWLDVDSTHLLYSILSLVVPVVLLVEVGWFLIVAMPMLFFDWLNPQTISEGIIYALFGIVILLVLIVAFVAFFATRAIEFIATDPTPATIPTEKGEFCWWIGLPLVVVGGLLYGLVSGIEIESTTQLLVLFPLFVFAAVLVSTRVLSVVRRSKSTADVALTVTTAVTGYIVVGGALEVIGFLLVIPYVSDPVADWGGMFSAYLPLLLALTIVLTPFDELEMLSRRQVSSFRSSNRAIPKNCRRCYRLFRH